LPVGIVGIIASTPDIGWPGHLTAYLLVMGLVALGAYLFSNAIFAIVRQKEEEILRRNRDLAAMNDVGSVINGSLPLDEVLNRTLDVILGVTGAEAGEIFLQEEGTDALGLRAVRGVGRDSSARIARLRLAENLLERITEEARTVVVHGSSDGPQTYAGVPLKSKGEVIGVMGIFAPGPGRVTPEDVELLDALGSQVAVAIENARLDAQLEALTVVQERHRIAREMHDGLSQQLGYLHLKVGELEEDPAIAPRRADLGLMKKVIARAYEEVRQAIFGLKMVSQNMELVPTLATYLKEFSEQTGIPVDLGVHDERNVRFPLLVEAQLTRIVQEALSNVRKHARAGHACVIFETDSAGASLTIRDDGGGFDPQEGASAGRSCFGLQTMKERAEAVGGVFTVESERGKGTQVTIRLPLPREESPAWTS
jgi:two-component system nitrate/nitrite sensor histidine kinase NarX